MGHKHKHEASLVWEEAYKEALHAGLSRSEAEEYAFAAREDYEKRHRKGKEMATPKYSGIQVADKFIRKLAQKKSEALSQETKEMLLGKLDEEPNPVIKELTKLIVGELAGPEIASQIDVLEQLKKKIDELKHYLVNKLDTSDQVETEAMHVANKFMHKLADQTMQHLSFPGNYSALKRFQSNGNVYFEITLPDSATLEQINDAVERFGKTQQYKHEVKISKNEIFSPDIVVRLETKDGLTFQKYHLPGRQLKWENGKWIQSI